MKTPKQIFLLAICFGIVKIGTAQDTTPRTTDRSTLGASLGVSGRMVNFGSLEDNAYLLGLPNEFQPVISGSIYLGKRDRLFFALETAATRSKKKGSYLTYQNVSAYFFSYSYSLDCFYPLLKKQKYLFGFLGITNVYSNITSKEQTLDYYFENSVIKQRALFNVGLMYELWNKVSKSNISALTIKAGYSYRITRAAWYQGKTVQQNKEKIDFGGPFVGITYDIWPPKRLTK